MSNLANYSPYNKTYKFILFQNQAYHEKAKRDMEPAVRTNLRYKRQGSRALSTSLYQGRNTGAQGLGNPEHSNLFKNFSEMPSEECPSPSISRRANRSAGISNSELSSPFKLQKSVFIDRQKRIIHKHQSYQKFRNKAINQDNKQLVARLLGASCQVIQNKKSQNSFNRHLKYREIRKVYREGGKRKHPLALGNTELLCPTLNQFNKSGRAAQFLEKDLSMCSARSATASAFYSPRKSQVQSPILNKMRYSQL